MNNPPLSGQNHGSLEKHRQMQIPVAFWCIPGKIALASRKIQPGGCRSSQGNRSFLPGSHHCIDWNIGSAAFQVADVQVNGKPIEDLNGMIPSFTVTCNSEAKTGEQRAKKRQAANTIRKRLHISFTSIVKSFKVNQNLSLWPGGSPSQRDKPLKCYGPRGGMLSTT